MSKARYSVLIISVVACLALVGGFVPLNLGDENPRTAKADTLKQCATDPDTYLVLTNTCDQEIFSAVGSLGGDVKSGTTGFLDSILDWDDRVEKKQTQEEDTESFTTQISLEQNSDRSIFREGFRRDLDNVQRTSEDAADSAVYEEYRNGSSRTSSILAGREAINDTYQIVGTSATKSHNDLVLTAIKNKQSLEKFNRSNDILALNSNGSLVTRSVSNTTELKNATSYDNSYIELENNITLQNSVSFGNGTHTVDLNGYELDTGSQKIYSYNKPTIALMNGDVNGVFADANRKLTLIDIQSGFKIEYEYDDTQFYKNNNISINKSEVGCCGGGVTEVSTPFNNYPKLAVFDPSNVSSPEATVELGNETYTAVNKNLNGETYKWVTPYDSSGQPIRNQDIVYNIPEDSSLSESQGTYINQSAWNSLWSELQTNLDADLTQAGSTSSGYLYDTYTRMENANDSNIPRVGQFNYNLTPQQVANNSKVAGLINYYPQYEGPVNPTETEVTIEGDNGTTATGDLYVLNATDVGVQNDTWTNGTKYQFNQSDSKLATENGVLSLNGNYTVSGLEENNSSVSSIANRDGYTEFEVQSVDEEWSQYQQASNETQEQIKISVEKDSGSTGGTTDSTGDISEVINDIADNIILILSLLVALAGIVLLLYFLFILT